MLTGGTARIRVQQSLCTVFNEEIVELYGNAKPYLKFWDEVEDFPFISVTCNTETREYQPGAFEWGFITANIRVYVKSESNEPTDELENLLVKVENLLRDNSGTLPIGSGCTATDIRVVSIDVDGGLLAPLGIGEITAVVQYQVN